MPTRWVDWKLRYLEHRYGVTKGALHVLRLSKETDYHSWDAWKHWLAYVLTCKWLSREYS